MTFDAGTTRRTVQVPIVNDNVLETVESFFATLSVDSNLYPGVNISPDRVDIEVSDDDGK